MGTLGLGISRPGALLLPMHSGNRMARSAERGREADYPSEVPASGWRDILLRVWEQIGTDNISMVAAGVAFYGLLAIFPAITAFVSIWGLAADPAQVQQ